MPDLNNPPVVQFINLFIAKLNIARPPTHTSTTTIIIPQLNGMTEAAKCLVEDVVFISDLEDGFDVVFQKQFEEDETFENVIDALIIFLNCYKQQVLKNGK